MVKERLNSVSGPGKRPLLYDRKEYVQRQRNEPTEHNGTFVHLRDFDPTNVSFILFQLTYPVDTRTHTHTKQFLEVGSMEIWFQFHGARAPWNVP